MFYVFINKFNKILNLITCIIKQRLHSLSAHCVVLGPTDIPEGGMLFLYDFKGYNYNHISQVISIENVTGSHQKRLP